MFGWFKNYDDYSGEIMNFVPNKRLVVKMDNGDLKKVIPDLDLMPVGFKNKLIRRWNNRLLG